MDLSGKFLIAMPALSDPRFERSVILMCSHSPEGSMGVIINKPLGDLDFLELLERLKIAKGDSPQDVSVLYGGPVEPGRGFVVHSDDWLAHLGSLRIPGGLVMTATQEVLEALGRGDGPSRAILALGYAGWGPGQLTDEIARNDWLTVDCGQDLVFSDTFGAKWSAALAALKIDPLTLSATSGRA